MDVYNSSSKMILQTSVFSGPEFRGEVRYVDTLKFLQYVRGTRSLINRPFTPTLTTDGEYLLH